MIVERFGRVSYEVGLELQSAARDRVLAGGADELLLLEHDPVVTLGRRGGQVDALALDRLGTPVLETDRGGFATWHGPGQLVGYPVVNVQRLGLKVPQFVRLIGRVLEDVVTDLGVAQARYDDARPGVYVRGAKVAAIGLHLQRGVSTHGFALNVSNELTGFDAIVPCGLTGVKMTTLALELTEAIERDDVETKVEQTFAASLQTLL